MGVLPRAAHIEGEVAVHAVGGAGHLVGQRLGGGGERAGIGHLEHTGHATHDGGATTGFEVFLVLRTRFAQVHLAVDHTRQDVEASAVDHLAPLFRAERAETDNAATGNGNIALSDTVMVDDGAALQDQFGVDWHGDGPAFLEGCSRSS